MNIYKVTGRFLEIDTRTLAGEDGLPDERRGFSQSVQALDETAAFTAVKRAMDRRQEGFCMWLPLDDEGNAAGDWQAFEAAGYPGWAIELTGEDGIAASTIWPDLLTFTYREWPA